MLINAMLRDVCHFYIKVMPGFLPLRVGKRKQDSMSEGGATPKKQTPCTGVDDGNNPDVRELRWMVQW